MARKYIQIKSTNAQNSVKIINKINIPSMALVDLTIKWVQGISLALCFPAKH